MSSDLVARVAVENTVFSFDKAFNYVVPKSLSTTCKAGVRVLVPFGRGDRKRQGIVMEMLTSETDNLKSIISVLDDEPVMSEEMLRRLQGSALLH